MRGSSVTPCTITPWQATEIAGCSLSHIYHNMGQFIRRRIGKVTLINKASIEAWIDRKTKTGEADLDAEADRILARIDSKA